jgi:hypothetical protein
MTGVERDLAEGEQAEQALTEGQRSPAAEYASARGHTRSTDI